MFALKFSTRSIRLTPPVRPVSLNGLTGGVSCSRSGNGHAGLTGLTGGPRVRVELRSPCEFRVVKGFLAGQDLPTLYKGPRPFERASPNRSLLFTTFISQILTFSNLVLSLFVSTTIRDVLSGLADLRATLGAPPPTGSLLRRRS
jgi:hypothetical protein